MPKRKSPTSFATTRAMVRDVEDLVDGEKWSLDRQAAEAWGERPWAGANVVVCNSLPHEPHPEHTYVVSPYVVELSWLIATLQTVCSDFIVYSNKEAFYGRLADAANRYLSQRLQTHHNPKDMCFAVVREAMRVVEDADRGELSGVRNEVRIKQIWVQLHPGASKTGAGIAVYWFPSSLASSLTNEEFSFKDKKYRIGESTQQIHRGEEVMHMAEYYESY